MLLNTYTVVYFYLREKKEHFISKLNATKSTSNNSINTQVTTPSILAPNMKFSECSIIRTGGCILLPFLTVSCQTCILGLPVL